MKDQDVSPTSLYIIFELSDDFDSGYRSALVEVVRENPTQILVRCGDIMLWLPRRSMTKTGFNSYIFNSEHVHGRFATFLMYASARTEEISEYSVT